MRLNLPHGLTCKQLNAWEKLTETDRRTYYVKDTQLEQHTETNNTHRREGSNKI